MSVYISTMERNIPAIPLLTSENYFTWKIKITSILTLKKLTSVLTEDCPDETKPKEKGEWEIKNDDAVAYIKLSLSDEQSLQFAEETNAKKLWEKIKITFTGKTEDRKIDAGNELKNIELRENENITDYIARSRGISTKCTALGLNISERELVFYTVRGLRGKFTRIREILKTQREKQMDEVLEILKEEEKSVLQHNGIKKSEAFLTRATNKEFSKCYICKKSNHLAKNCYFRNRNNPKINEEKRTFQRRDFKDKQKYVAANLAIQEETEQEQKPPVNFALTVNEQKYENTSNDVWILDSGSSSHMCNNLNFFHSLKNDKGYIQLAGKNSLLNYEGIGNVIAKTVVNNSKNNILTIDDVIFAPNLRNNLISVSKLIDKGYELITDDKNILVLSKDDQIVLKAFNVNNRFEIFMEPYKNVSPNFSECNLVKNTESYDIWHKRLCHLNPQYMIKMQDIIGINLKNVENSACESCDISKINRKHHPVINYEQSNSVLELIHADLAGPINTNSLGNSKYFLVLVDDYSGMYFSYFLKHKNEVFDKFTTFKNKYENLLNKKIKRLRTDNGLEFVNKELDSFLDKSGIIHEKTVPYNPESNGKAERAIKILVERARTILYESKLPIKFWAEAVSCSTHASNVTPRKNKQKIPFELWTGKKPKISYLKTFGCVIYYHISKQLRNNKFDVPGKRGIFVGYSRERIGYRIYDIEKDIIIEERSVKFNESIKGSEFLRTKSEPSLWNVDNLMQFNDLESEFLNENNSLTDNIPSDDSRSLITLPLNSDLSENKQKPPMRKTL